MEFYYILEKIFRVQMGTKNYFFTIVEFRFSNKSTYRDLFYFVVKLGDFFMASSI
jgi:hypothetical protein